MTTAHIVHTDTDEVLVTVYDDGTVEASVRPRYSLGTDMWVPARVEAVA